MVQIGMIHGRFQPFHNGHFDYLKAALLRCQRLIVGITNPEPSTIVVTATDDHRHREDANPYSFYLRARMIQETIASCPSCSRRATNITIVPFPIHTPAVWEHYVSGREVVQFMRLIDPWDHEKKVAFVAYGFAIDILDGERMMSGSEVRADIHSGISHWWEKVPDGTRRMIEARRSDSH